jgi:hypothetical protein
MEAKENPFIVRDCALVAIATGEKAQSLNELRNKIAFVRPSSIYYHFWGGRLGTHFEHREYQNDFALWAHKFLHDEILAERLGILDPTEYKEIEQLRLDMLDIIEERLDEGEAIAATSREDQFYFMHSKVIVFDSPHVIVQPKELPHVIPSLTSSSIFYHFIDAMSRSDKREDDFSAWLRDFNNEYLPLIDEIHKIDPYFISLGELQQKLTSVIAIDLLKKSETQDEELKGLYGNSY